MKDHWRYKEENSRALDETKKQKNWDMNYLPCDDEKDGLPFRLKYFVSHQSLILHSRNVDPESVETLPSIFHMKNQDTLKKTRVRGSIERTCH